MFLCFHGLSIPMRVPACSLAYIKFSREAFVRNMSFLQGNTLNWPFSIKLFCFKMSNQFNVSLFPWSKYTNEEHQPVPWHILNFLQKLLSETCHFHKETHQNTHSLPSNSASECPISSMFLCFRGLSIPMKSASLFLGLF